MASADRAEPVDPTARGRYVVYGEIASGGMATVEYGRRLGPLGFARPVAIKRPHAQFLKDPRFVSMFVDEARLSARMHHANVVPVLDLVDDDGRLALVMEYVHGESLATLFALARERNERVPVSIATALVAAVLHGLHAAHETRDDQGEPIGIVHRDVSPQNVLVTEDGVPRVLDFGIAKGAGRLTATPTGHIKGKLLYMAPEQLHAEHVDRSSDIYAASCVLWEALIGPPLFEGPSESSVIKNVLEQPVKAPSSLRSDVPRALDDIVLRGLARIASLRFATARDMALALERDVGIATQSEVGAWVQELAGDRLARRAKDLQGMQAKAEAAHAARVVEVHAQRFDAPAVTSNEQTIVRPSAAHAALLRRSAARRWIALGLVALVVLLVWWGLSDASAPEPVPPAAHAPQAEPASPQPPVAELPLEPVAPPPVVTAPQEPAPQEPAAKPRKQVSAQRVATPERPAKPAKPDCSQPYVIDAQGIKHPRPECL
jgi:hypothetical protein